MTQKNSQSRTYKDCAVLSAKYGAWVSLTLLVLWVLWGAFSGNLGVILSGLPVEALLVYCKMIVVPRLVIAIEDFLIVSALVFAVTAGKVAWSQRSGPKAA